VHKKTCLVLALLVLSVMFVATANAQEADAPEPEVKHSIGHKILFYLPNRIGDILDIYSVGVALPMFPKNWMAGFVHANAHVTRGMQIGAGNTNENIIVGLSYKRNLVPFFDEKYEISGGPLTFSKYKISRGNNKTDYGKVGIWLPTDEPFEKGLMDYWGVGGEVTILPIGVRAEFHPVEVVDLLLGFFMIDIGNDDR